MKKRWQTEDWTERNKKVSQALKGKPHSKEHNRKVSEVKKGVKFTKEHRRNLSIANKGQKAWNKGMPMSKEQKKKLSIAHKGKYLGEKSPSWKGGLTPISKRIRNSPRYIQWRQSIFLRDDFICQKCEQRGGRLHTHHCKKSFAELLQEVMQNLSLLPLFEAVMIYTPFWDLDNGETLCHKCHKKTKNYGKKNKPR